ncbi:hypothetical protein [Steroidobacter cummioxidans]|uniref:hypothetical protein n=1 Tax=Steroidobacter cummioxidans TaxID=1803913 RepID=UPI000E31CC38|nr:hypothetical protein [Steroidobacter cummioxidans]
MKLALLISLAVNAVLVVIVGRQTLSADELFEYQLRTSPTAQAMFSNGLHDYEKTSGPTDSVAAPVRVNAVMGVTYKE